MTQIVLLNILKEQTIQIVEKLKEMLVKVKKKFVASNQKWKCSSCNELLDATYEIDHITPLYKGGTNEVSNLKALCRNCHGKKTLMDRIS